MQDFLEVLSSIITFIRVVVGNPISVIIIIAVALAYQKKKETRQQQQRLEEQRKRDYTQEQIELHTQKVQEYDQKLLEYRCQEQQMQQNNAATEAFCECFASLGADSCLAIVDKQRKELGYLRASITKTQNRREEAQKKIAENTSILKRIS